MDWKLSLHKMVSLTQMGVGLSARRRLPVSSRKRVATFIAAVCFTFLEGVTLAGSKQMEAAPPLRGDKPFQRMQSVWRRYHYR